MFKLCNRLSPESGAECNLYDTPSAHMAGHRGDSEFRTSSVSWAIDAFDRARWERARLNRRKKSLMTETELRARIGLEPK